MMEKYQQDSDHFSTLSPPLAPIEQEVKIYQTYLQGKTLLLGYTKQLISLCDYSMDLNLPVHLKGGKKYIEKDWFSIDDFYDTIIGDGVINLVGGELINYLSKHCRTLVIRFFTEKIEGMKYATYFRHNTEMLLPDEIIPTQDRCVILVWRFN